MNVNKFSIMFVVSQSCKYMKSFLVALTASRGMTQLQISVKTNVPFELVVNWGKGQTKTVKVESECVLEL